MFPKNMLVAKTIVALLIGLLCGYGMGTTLESDSAKARTLTLEEYVADFETYKAGLESSDISMQFAVVIAVVMVIGIFALYEGLAIVVAKGLAAMGGRDYESPFTPTPRL